MWRYNSITIAQQYIVNTLRSRNGFTMLQAIRNHS